MDGTTKAMCNFRIFLRNFFYNQQNINYIMNRISLLFDLFSIEYIESSYCIQFKIKKTDVKKNANFNHNTDFYYDATIDIFRDIFRDNISYINKLLIDNNRYDLIQYSNLLATSFSKLTYSINTVGDNIVNIYL